MNNYRLTPLFFLSGFLFLVAVLPVLASFDLFRNILFYPESRISSFFELTGGIITFIASVIIFKKNVLFQNVFQLKSDNVNSISPSLIFILALIPVSSFLIRAVTFTYEAYNGLYLGDFDFTNISEAINNTAKGNGFLSTPFLNTGITPSYLGHHFSPSIAILTPLYSIANFVNSTGLLHQQTHLLYGFALNLMMLIAALSWIFFINKELVDPVSIISFSSIFFWSIVSWRLTASFHYETIAFAFAMVSFATEKRKGFAQIIFWCSIIIWMGIKEDAPVYTLLYGAALFFEERNQKSRGFILVILSVIFAVLALIIRSNLAGDTGVGWINGWLFREEPKLLIKPFLILLASAGFLPLFAPRFFIVAILPVALLHFISGHQWHATYTGHYIYSIAPLLFRGSMAGLKRLDDWNGSFPVNRLSIIALVLSFSMITASFEKSSPYPVIAESNKLKYIEQLLPLIENNACVQTNIEVSPHIQLDKKVFPLYSPSAGPYKWNNNYENFVNDLLDNECNVYYLIVNEKSVFIPFYTEDHLNKVKNFADRNMNLLMVSGGYRLYRISKEEWKPTSHIQFPDY